MSRCLPIFPRQRTSPREAHGTGLHSKSNILPSSALRPIAVVLIGATTLIMIWGLTIGDYPIIDGRFPAAIGGNSSWDGYPAPAHQGFRKPKRARRERPSRRAGDQGHTEPRPTRHEERHP